MMRVAYVCTDPGVPPFGCKGASVHVQAVLTQLLDRGAEVHLLTPRPEPPPPRLAGVRVHPLPAVRGAGPVARERAARLADRVVATVLDRLASERPLDLVYERYALWGRTSMSWAQWHEVPSVLEVNAPLPDEQSRYRALYDRVAADQVARTATGRAGVVACVSDPVAAWVRGLGAADPSRVHVVPNGVDTRRFAARPVRRSADVFTLGFLGTLKPWHGVDLLLQALALLRRSDPSWRLLVVGDGPERPLLGSLVAALGIAGCVELTGAVAPEEVPGLLSRMDVAVAPYPPATDFYFSPLKIYEYLAAGLPVIASDVGPLPALLTAGPRRLGSVYPAGSATGLAEALLRLRGDPDLRAALGANARRAAVERHDWSRVVGRILDLSGVRHGATQAS
ncbi:MAG: glycosyltransferase family 4 protein [Nocardioidaceae bacterium]|nr:glycosyltransferase family 4 protein [Nocardioidaceae bacterium]